MLLLTTFLVLLCLIDVSAIICGYFEIPFYYWYFDSTNGVLLLFRDDLFEDYEKAFILSRDWIITLVYFSAVWSLFAAVTSRYFGKRRYGASQWPLTLWKTATFLMVMRLFSICIVTYKFHYEIIEFDSIKELLTLYRNGSVGIVPALLFVSIIVNLSVAFGSIRTIMNTSEWYQLNVAKRL